MLAETVEAVEHLTAFHIVSTCACSNLRKTARAVTQVYDESLRALGLRASQFALLTAVRLLGPVTVNNLAEAAIMDRTTLTRNLKPLEKQRLIRIEPGNDRRMREVSLTPQGESLLARAVPLWREAQCRMADNMGAERLDGLVDSLSLAVQAARGQ